MVRILAISFLSLIGTLAVAAQISEALHERHPEFGAVLACAFSLIATLGILANAALSIKQIVEEEFAEKRKERKEARKESPRDEWNRNRRLFAISRLPAGYERMAARETK